MSAAFSSSTSSDPIPFVLSGSSDLPLADGPWYYYHGGSYRSHGTSCYGDGDGCDNLGLAIGLAVGIPVVVVGLTLGIYFGVRHCQKKRRLESRVENDNGIIHPQPSPSQAANDEAMMGGSVGGGGYYGGSAAAVPPSTVPAAIVPLGYGAVPNPYAPAVYAQPPPPPMVYNGGYGSGVYYTQKTAAANGVRVLSRTNSAASFAKSQKSDTEYDYGAS